MCKTGIISLLPVATEPGSLQRPCRHLLLCHAARRRGPWRLRTKPRRPGRASASTFPSCSLSPAPFPLPPLAQAWPRSSSLPPSNCRRLEPPRTDRGSPQAPPSPSLAPPPRNRTGRAGADAIVLAPARSVRRSPLSVPADSGRRGRPRPRLRARVRVTSPLAPFPRPLLLSRRRSMPATAPRRGRARARPACSPGRAPGLGRPGDRRPRPPSRPRAQPGPA